MRNTLNWLKESVDKEVFALTEGLTDYIGEGEFSALLGKVLGDYNGSGSKRLRGVLMLAGYLGFQERLISAPVKAAASMELMHSFALIHDDLIDKAELRRGRPALHLAFAKGCSGIRKRDCGESMAMVAGDILFAYGVRMFIDACRGMPQGWQALDVLMGSAVNTGEGQFNELAYTTFGIEARTEEEVWRVYDMKTGDYTFRTPLRIGCLLGGADDALIREVDRAGWLMGRAYQLLDDLYDLTLCDNGQHKTGFSDLRTGILTIPLLRLYHRCGQEEKGVIKGVLSNGASDRSEYLRVSELIREKGVYSELLKEAESFCMDAERLIKGSGCSVVLKGYMGEVLDRWIRKSSLYSERGGE
ncbi:MAG: polyprenyl synthetase family protein [Chitinivibrionales bacterium]